MELTKSDIYVSMCELGYIFLANDNETFDADLLYRSGLLNKYVVPKEYAEIALNNLLNNSYVQVSDKNIHGKNLYMKNPNMETSLVGVTYWSSTVANINEEHAI